VAGDDFSAELFVPISRAVRSEVLTKRQNGEGSEKLQVARFQLGEQKKNEQLSNCNHFEESERRLQIGCKRERF
ncbi:MAG: hypothetical protein IJE77_07955, partial [Thermoguttaceae bacterium]|nr:hypothetical protein [Thermoguttaceae bacterium]